MKYFRSHWYYWYTGNKLIAVMSMVISGLTMWGFSVMAAGFSVWAIAVAVVLESNGLLLALAYLFALRPYIPEIPDYYPEYLHFKDKADSLIIKQLVIPAILSFFFSRLTAFTLTCLFRGK